MAPSPHVVVAGAGPTGLTAALKLAQHGIPVVVLEAGPTLSRESRASTFHPPTLEMLDHLGVGDELHSRGIVASTFQFRDRRDGVIAELDLALLADETRFPYRLQCEQSKLTPILLEKLATYAHAEVRFAAPVEHVDVDGDGVTVKVRDGSSVQGDLLIGADGASSQVRRSLGLSFEGKTYPESYLVVSTPYDVRLRLPDIAEVNYISDPDEWLVMLRTPEHWRVLFPVDPEGASEPSPDEIQARLRAVLGGSESYPVDHTSLYNVHQRIVDSFKHGPVLLAGDAAHVNNPLGGLGMNSGIQDAYYLVTAIGLAGDAAGPELEAYADERRRVQVEHVLPHSDSSWTAMRETDPAARAEWHAELRAVANDPDRAREQMRRATLLDVVRASRFFEPSGLGSVT